MNRKCIAAYTKGDPSYPGYVNITNDNGVIVLTVRGDPKIIENAGFICGYASDRGKIGRCTPGDENCNNYCNSAPEKGPMQDRPKSCTQVAEGKTASISIAKEEWEEMVSKIEGALK